MNDFLNINYSEKIVAFLDGELDAAERESLFLTMASSPQLQEEMRQQIIISQSLKKSLLIPPETLKNNIFAAIGVASVPAPNTPKTVYSKLLNKRLTLILSSLLLLLLVSFVSYQFFDNEPLQANKTNTSAPIKHDLPKEIPITSSFSENYQATPKQISKSRSSTVITKPIPEVNTNSSQSSELLAIAQEEQLPSLDIPAYFIDESDIFEPNSNFTFKKKKRFSQIFETVFTKTEFLDNLSMQIRFFEAKNFVNANIKPISEPILNNFGFAIIYDIDNNNSVAIELGQEDFVQKFKGNLDEFPALIKQNYTAFWAGASYQYTFEDYRSISPFVRGMIGGTRIGPVSKIIIGGKYYLTNKIYVFAGFENTGLFYEFQNKWHSSLKSGLSGGVSVKF